MFKTKALILIILLNSLNAYAQNYHKRLSLSKKFLKKVHVKEVLDTMLWDYETNIFNQTEELFKKNHLDVYKDNDYEFFQSNLMREFLFSKKNILDQIKYRFKRKSYDSLKYYLKQINQGKLQQVVYTSGLHSLIKELLEQEMTEIKKFSVPKYLQYLINKHKPVPLKIKYNGKPVSAENMDMDIFVETNNVDYKKVSILDKKHSVILKPEGYTYEQIQKLIVKFKDKTFEFKPDKNSKSHPNQFNEVNSVVSKYSFNEIPVWNIDIIETPEHISLQLGNVIEARVVKSKGSDKVLMNKN